MRCFSCGKNFDYEKYYGICPKCGCFNHQESSQEQHQAYHDTYDGGYRHSYQTSMDLDQKEESIRKSGKGNLLLIFGVVFFICSMLLSRVLLFSMDFDDSVPSEEEISVNFDLQMEEQQGTSFPFQNLDLCVEECRKIADSESLPGLEPGKQILAIRVSGTGNGEYEDENRLAEPYLEAGGHFYHPISSYDFEPYARMLDVMPLLSDSDFLLEEACDGWFAFLVDTGVEKVRFSLEECAWDSWEKEELRAIHTVTFSVEELEGEGEE